MVVVKFGSQIMMGSHIDNIYLVERKESNYSLIAAFQSYTNSSYTM